MSQAPTSYRDLRARAGRVAAALAAGVGKGDRVGILLANDGALEAHLTYHASHRLGTINVPLNTRYVKRELAYVLEFVEPAAIVFSHEFADLLGGLGDSDGEAALLEVGPGPARLGVNLALAVEGAEADVRPALLAGDDDADWIFTSGTTGNPKAVALTHQGSVCCGYQAIALFARGPSRGAHAHRALRDLDRAHPFADWVEFAVLDPESAEVGDGEIGELCLRGPSTMSRYVRDPEATAAALKHGWLYTGDMALRDDAGFVYYVDRGKQLIRRGGLNISSAEVEGVLAEHPGVLKAAAVGMPNPVLGEDVRGVVVAATNPPPAEDELIAFCRERLADYKAPAKIDFVEALPRNAMKGVMKGVLRGEAGALGAPSD